MKLENQVVNVELSRKMKEYGYYQMHSSYYWKSQGGEFLLHPYPCEYMMDEKDIAAPTVAELGDALPSNFPINNYPHKLLQSGKSPFVLEYKEVGNFNKPGTILVYDDYEANARAKMWICLKENNLI